MMKDLKKALELRKNIKKKKPNFLKQDAYKKDKLKKNWRRPRGRHSKLRMKLKGHGEHPSMGYSSPTMVRGLSPEGLREIHVNTLGDLKKVKKGDGIILGSTIGLKKKLELLKKIEEQALTVLNLRDITKFIEKSEAKLSEKKKESKKKEEDKKQAKEEAIKKAEEKKKEEEKKTEEELKKEEEDEAKEEARKRSMQQPV